MTTSSLSPSDANNSVIDIEICKQSPELLLTVLKTYGYAHLTNHGIPKENIDSCFKTTRQFFSLPDSIKKKYAKPKSIITYHGYNAKSNGDHVVREYFHALGDGGQGSQGTNTIYPHEVPDMESAIRRLLHGPKIRALNKVLLQSLEGAIVTDKIQNFLDYHKSVLQFRPLDKQNGFDDENEVDLNYSYFSSMFYPKLINVDGSIDKDNVKDGKRQDNEKRVERCAPHTDCSTYTLLFLEDGDDALQRYCKINKKWVSIRKVPDSILLIPGDVLETVSAGTISALVHRVPTPESGVNLKSRQSLPLYILPDSATPYPKMSKNPETANDENEGWTFGKHYEKLIADRYFK